MLIGGERLGAEDRHHILGGGDPGLTAGAAPPPLGDPCGTPTPQAVHIALQFPQRSETLVTDPAPRFGFVEFAETWNGRMAMLGFVIGLATELLTGQGILQQIGLG